VLDLLARNFLGSKFNLGFSLFRRFFEFPVLATQNGPVGTISRITRGSFGGSLTGSYALSEISKIDLTVQSEHVTSQSAPGVLTPAQGMTRRMIAPAYSFDTTDHLINPHAGQKFTLGAAFTGGLLGGEVNTMRPSLEYKVFHADPLSRRRNTLAFRGMVS